MSKQPKEAYSEKFNTGPKTPEVQKVNVTAQKFDDWVYRLWVTSPTNYPVSEFYNIFREKLWDMYTAQKPDEQAG